MTLKRRDLLLSGGGMAVTFAVGQLTWAKAANPQTPRTPTKWRREADVVVIGSGATGLPAAIVAREAGASVVPVKPSRTSAAMPSPAVATSRSAAVPACKKKRHRGFAGPVVSRPDRLVGGRTERVSRLPL